MKTPGARRHHAKSPALRTLAQPQKCLADDTEPVGDTPVQGLAGVGDRQEDQRRASLVILSN